MKVIETKKAPRALGPYSQGYIYQGILYTSGQIGIDPLINDVTAIDIEGQTEQVCKNLQSVLQEAGTDFEHVIKTTCFLSDMDDFGAFNKIYEKYFTSKPARSCVAVKTLPKGVLCEIELIACVK